MNTETPKKYEILFYHAHINAHDEEELARLLEKKGIEIYGEPNKVFESDDFVEAKKHFLAYKVNEPTYDNYFHKYEIECLELVENTFDEDGNHEFTDTVDIKGTR